MTSSSASAPAPGRPLFLLSNDDGVHSEGLHRALAALAGAGDVAVCAPESEQSAVSHSLSLHTPRRLRRLDAAGSSAPIPGTTVFAVDGTPADCVYVALHAGARVLARRPDVIVSGINRGLNLGQDAFYSGTIAAAREGALRGIPGLAVSAEVGADLDAVAALTTRIALQLVGTDRRLLSLNVPRVWNGEVRAARLGTRIYEETIDFRRDPRGREYLWIGGPGVSHASDPGSDTDAFDAGAATLTSLLLDLTREGDPLLGEIARTVVSS
jgi:5'-nucleotidase